MALHLLRPENIAFLIMKRQKQVGNLTAFFLLVAAFAITEAKQKSYEGYSIIRVLPRNDKDLEYLADFRSKTTTYEFLNDGIRRDFVDILSPPIIINMTPTQEPGRAMEWESYHRLQDIHDWMDELAAANDFVETEIIGQSYEGRDLKVLKINTANSPVKFWIDGGLHAREWITPATVTYIINEMVNNYEANKDIVDAYQWYILPVHNPDGYEYSHTDVRNYDRNTTDFGEGHVKITAPLLDVSGGASGDKCSEIYAGPEPFSEPCTRIVSEYILGLNADGSLLAFFTIHNYSQMWLTPFGYDYIYPDNYADLVISTNILESMKRTGLIERIIVSGANINSGPSDDWALGAAQVPFVYTLELRDTGEFGFLLPEEQIIPTGEETEWITPATVTYIINEMVNNYQANKDIVDAYQWYILPVHNPDGYEYSHTDDRFWRGTRQDHGSPFGCIGADPNRNWDFHWMEGGASGDKCSEIYAGPEPFSEPCTRLVSEYILGLNADGSLLAFFTIHNYSQMWLTPFGYDYIYPDNYADLERVGKKGMDALAALYGTKYKFGPSAIVLTSTIRFPPRSVDINSGPSDDWALGAAKVPYVEWITPGTVTYIINEMVNNYKANKDIVDAYQWYFLPVHNPDGYEYSRTNDRLWRKTRQNHNSPSGCIEGGASSDKCSEIYAGPKPFSEPCTRHVADYILRLNQDKSLLAFITIHSYAQMWQTPFGYNQTYPDNYADMERVGTKGIDALTALYGTAYTFDINSGPSDDWAFGVAKVPYVYTLELRDTGEFGFLLPQEQIIPTAKETWSGIKAAAKEILA
ncbi:unnamed protein product [Notodromas monacha]|uniref:Peptidase M14 domain-containing protein n=1 Tax=Notodromas monacha TaxID=399045 RepID=A0A7R9GCI0_9CRUS|nr:unnamed protein product [Notodromas monacha]CAG0917676.1 unnamed protein product [Notodromas monacha]